MKLLDDSLAEIKLGSYLTAPATALTDVSLHPRVQDYRRASSARMIALDRHDAQRKLPASDYHVSRKVDGEFTVIVWRDGEILTVNPGGTVRTGLPVLEEAARLLQEAGVNEALIAAELFVNRPDGRRPRIHDVVQVARKPESADDLETLQLAVFDIISLNGSPPENFSAACQEILRLFDSGTLVRPVDARSATTADEVLQCFDEWVDQEGAEGLVVRSETAGSFKIKPRHTIDAVVLGFTESTDDRQGMLHDLLLGTVRGDGAIHVLCRVGGGFSDELRREMLSDLKDMVVDSDYTEVSGDHVAYEMVRPEWVIEITCLDFIAQTTRGGSINRMVLNWDADASTWRIIRQLPGVSVISPQFVRRREDKTVHIDEVSIRQVADVVDIPMVDRDATQLALPKSELTRRAVFTKELKGAVMVRKFLLWKTGKEQESDDFPAWVLHYTDFSPNRRTPLAREIRVSNSQDQIEQLWETLQSENIKKGWKPYGTEDEADSDAAATTVKEAKPAAKKKTTAPKKAAAKKAATKKAAPKKAAAKKKAAPRKKASRKSD